MIPSLVLVEIWLWTPFVMIIVLGGLASLPTEPYEAALIDGANQWQMFWNITYPLVLPFLVVALIMRTIDALKVFETIWAICNGGPGTASEVLNVYLYAQAFAYNQVGTALGRGGGVLRHHRGAVAGAAVGAPEGEVVMSRTDCWTRILAQIMSARMRAVHSMNYRTRNRIRKLVDKAALALSVAVLLAPCLFVFFWMISLSLKYDIDNTAWPPVFWPEEATFDNFAKVFDESPMFLYFWNSVQVTGSATLVALHAGRPGGLRHRQGAAPTRWPPSCCSAA